MNTHLFGNFVESFLMMRLLKIKIYHRISKSKRKEDCWASLCSLELLWKRANFFLKLLNARFEEVCMWVSEWEKKCFCYHGLKNRSTKLVLYLNISILMSIFHEKLLQISHLKITALMSEKYSLSHVHTHSLGCHSGTQLQLNMWIFTDLLWLSVLVYIIRFFFLT